MKKCNYCGFENPNEAVQCVTCHTPLVVPSQTAQPEPSGEYVISPEEKCFWERMTFRQFAILMIRLQAVWLLFYAVIDATYLPRYFSLSSRSPLYTQISFTVFLAILRIILHVAVAVALIQHAERVLGWLVKDCIPKPPPPALEPTATARSDSSKT
jgi:hypothetical protein